MCGIAGWFVRPGARAPNEPVLRAMNDALAHRGPDDAGWRVEPGVGLAMRRLSIIDLSGGHQPLSNEDGTIWVVFNGEIYNFEEVRERLVARGHRFATRSDTEVLVHGYEEDGEAFLSRLRGMFALALWDRRNQRLLLARDRLGKKPLHLIERDGVVYFASEMKSFAAAGLLAAEEIDPVALRHYLLLGWIPGRRTIYRGVRRLPAAHRLVLEGPGERESRWWSLPPVRTDESRSEDELAESLLATLEESVRLRLISDVPVGALLSGGVDSSLVTALMARHHAGPVRTFTIAFQDEGFDESGSARDVAARLGTTHHEETVRLEAVSLLPRLVAAFDEPFGDATALPQLVLSEMARRHVTVALSGDGGDELFGGYPRYRRLARVLRWRALPEPLRRLTAGAAGLLGRAGQGPAERLRQGLDGGEAEAYLPGLSLLLPGQLLDEAADELASDWPERGWGEELTREWGTGGRTGLDAAMGFDLSLYLVDDILAKVDRTSMACSLEVRVPLLDHRFVEQAAELPVGRKTGPGEDKRLLRRIARRVLPEEMLARPKHGFTVPLDRWFRADLRETARERFEDRGSALRDLFPAGLPLRLLERHASGRIRCGEILWALLILDLWSERFRAGGRGLLQEGPEAAALASGAVSGAASGTASS